MARPVRDGALSVAAIAALLLLSGVVAGLHRSPPDAGSASRVGAGAVAQVNGLAVVDVRERADADARRWTGAGAIGATAALVALVLCWRLEAREPARAGRTPAVVCSRGPPTPVG